MINFGWWAGYEFQIVRCTCSSVTGVNVVSALRKRTRPTGTAARRRPGSYKDSVSSMATPVPRHASHSTQDIELSQKTRMCWRWCTSITERRTSPSSYHFTSMLLCLNNTINVTWLYDTAQFYFMQKHYSCNLL